MALPRVLTVVLLFSAIVLVGVDDAPNVWL
jgi:hypothetical protein